MRPDIVLPLPQADHAAQHVPRMNTDSHVNVHACGFSHLPMGGRKELEHVLHFWLCLFLLEIYQGSFLTYTQWKDERQTYDLMYNYQTTGNKCFLKVNKNTKNDSIQYLLRLYTIKKSVLTLLLHTCQVPF